MRSAFFQQLQLKLMRCYNYCRFVGVIVRRAS